jgi:hypothetical protein
MRKIAALLILCLASAVWGSSCGLIPAEDSRPTPTLSEPTGTPGMENPYITNLIGELINSPQRAEEEVLIIGYFRGWDQLHEMQSSPPVSRSDWVIADDSGAIYVTGPLPEGLDSSSADQVQTLIRLVATVREKSGQVYLEAKGVDVIPAP